MTPEERTNKVFDDYCALLEASQTYRFKIKADDPWVHPFRQCVAIAIREAEAAARADERERVVFDIKSPHMCAGFMDDTNKTLSSATVGEFVDWIAGHFWTTGNASDGRLDNDRCSQGADSPAIEAVRARTDPQEAAE